MENIPPPRVDIPTPPRITEPIDATLPLHIKTLHRPHGKTTRANIPVIPQPEITPITVDQIPNQNTKVTCSENNISQKPTTAPRRSPRQRTHIITPKAPIFVSQSAVYKFLSKALEPNSKNITPLNIEK